MATSEVHHQGAVHHQEQSQVMVLVAMEVILTGDGLLHEPSREMASVVETCQKEENRDSIELVGERQYQASSLAKKL